MDFCFFFVAETLSFSPSPPLSSNQLTQSGLCMFFLLLIPSLKLIQSSSKPASIFPFELAVSNSRSEQYTIFYHHFVKCTKAKTFSLVKWLFIVFSISGN